MSRLARRFFPLVLVATVACEAEPPCTQLVEGRWVVTEEGALPADLEGTLTYGEAACQFTMTWSDPAWAPATGRVEGSDVLLEPGFDDCVVTATPDGTELGIGRDKTASTLELAP